MEHDSDALKMCLHLRLTTPHRLLLSPTCLSSGIPPKSLPYASDCAPSPAHTSLGSTGSFADEARFPLWDRSGAVKTERFSYLESPQTLAEFFTRFLCMDDAQRGWDQIVALATPNMGLHFSRRLFGSSWIPCRHCRLASPK